MDGIRCTGNPSVIVMPPNPRIALLVLSCGLAACAGHEVSVRRAPAAVAPAFVLGRFADDYGIQYNISADEWHQQPRARYRIVQWHADQQYLIARNDAANPSDQGLWTRIDWMLLPGMPPWEWAFCLSAYKAATAAEAEGTDISRRQTPRSGCNGHPFSRMQRATRVK